MTARLRALIESVCPILMVLGVVFWSGVVVVGILIGIAIWSIVTDRQIKLLHKGMTREEVIAILGTPKHSDGNSFEYSQWSQDWPLALLFNEDGKLIKIGYFDEWSERGFREPRPSQE